MKQAEDSEKPKHVSGSLSDDLIDLGSLKNDKKKDEISLF